MHPAKPRLVLQTEAWRLVAEETIDVDGEPIDHYTVERQDRDAMGVACWRSFAAFQLSLSRHDADRGTVTVPVSVLRALLRQATEPAVTVVGGA
jgi:hypothetical protein